MRLYREGDFNAALATYGQVILTDPEFAEAYYGRAVVCYALGNCDQAINDCNRAIELRRRFAEAYLLRGAAHWGLASLLPQGDPSRASLCEQTVSDCTYTLEAQPHSPHAGRAHFNRGLAYLALGNSAMAKYDLENAVALLADDGWRTQAEQWLAELKRPRPRQKYERQGAHG